MKLEDALKSNKFASIKHKAVLEVIYTATWINKINTDFFKPWGISTQQFNILRILRGSRNAGKECLTVHEIKERMLDKTPNTTRLIDKLLLKKWVDRTRCEDDRRVVWVNITQAGLDVLEEIDKEMHQIDFVTENITDKEAEELARILDKIRNK